MTLANASPQDIQGESSDQASISEWAVFDDWQIMATVWENPAAYVNTALAYENQQKWLQAAEHWLNAAECQTSGLSRLWSRMRLDVGSLYVMDIPWQTKFKFRAAENWQLGQDYAKAASLWHELDAYPRAARCYQKIAYYQQAAQMWEKCQCWQEAIEAWKMTQNWGRVAFQSETKLGNLSAAATAYIQNHQLPQAGRLYQQLYQTSQQRSYLKQARDCFAQSESWVELADVYVQLGDVEAAITLLKQHQCYEALASLLEELNDYAEAASYWLKANQILEAGRCFELAQRWPAAAACYESLKAWQAAADLWIKHQAEVQDSIVWLNAARCYRNIPNYSKAAEAALNAGDTEAAIKDWSLAKEWSKVATLQESLGQLREAANAWYLAKNYQKSAELSELLGEPEDLKQAARCWEELRNWVRLAEVYEQLEDFRAAALAWEKDANYEAAIVTLYKVPNLERVAEICEQFLDDLQQAAHLRKELGQFRRAALLHEKRFEKTSDAEALQAAITCWTLDENWHQVAETYKRLGDSETALQILVNYELYPEAAQLAEEQHRYRIAAEYWHTAGKILKAARCYQAGGYWKEAAECHEELGAWRTAAEFWKQYQSFTQDLAIFQEVARCYRLVPEYTLAAEAAEHAGDIEAAIKDWGLATRWHKVAALYEGQNKTLEAAQTWSLVKEYSRAAELYEQLTTAVDSQPEYFNYAVNCWRQAKNWQRLGELYERQGEYAEAASLWEAQNDLQRAITNWEQLQDWSEAGRLYKQLKEWASAIEFYQKAEPRHWPSIYECALQLSDWTLAATAAEKSQNWLGAAEAYQKLGTPEAQTKAAALYDQAHDWSRAATLWQTVGNLYRAKESWKKAQQWLKVIQLCQQLGTPASGLEAAGIYERNLKQFDKAASLYFQYQHLPEARRCWKLCDNVEPLVKAAQTAGRLEEVAAIWEAKENWLELGDTLAAMGHYCAAIQKYHAALHTDPEPHTQKPKSLPEPPELQLPPFLEGNSWIQKILTGLISLAEVPATIISLVGYIAWDRLVRYVREREDYEKRLQEIELWEKGYAKQKQDHQNTVSLKLKNTLLMCGCREHCTGGQG